MFAKAFRWLDPILIIGLLLSITIGVAMVLTGNDTIHGLTIGLLSTLTTLGVDLIARLHRSEQSFIEATGLMQMLSDQSLGESLKEIANNYKVIKRYDYDVFSKVADANIEECRIKITELASGSLRLVGNSVQEFGSIEFERAKKHIKVIHRDGMEYWNSDFGKRYFKRNLEALKRGVKIIRIFAITEEQARKYIDILKEQEAAGIDIKIMDPQFVNLADQDFLLFDDSILMLYETDAIHQYKIENVILYPQRVKRAVAEFDNLVNHPYAKLVKDFS